MKKSTLLNSLILAALAAPGLAMAEGSPFSGNVGLFTDYLFRGISQTAGKPAIQGGFDYAHPSGFYAGVWGSNVSWINDVGGIFGPRSETASSVELDTYLGYTNSFATDFSYDVGYLRYNYPGVYVSGVTKPDTDEIYGSIGWKWVTLKYSYALGDTFGVSEAKGTNYVDLSASYTIEGPGVTLDAHYGKQTYKGATADAAAAAGSDPSYSDYSLGVSKDFSGYVAGLKYSNTNVSNFYTVDMADQSTKDLGKSTVVLSITHAM